MAQQLVIGMFQMLGLSGAWRLPENTSVDYLSLEHWTDLARQCEDAGVDFLFFADDYGYPVVDDEVVDLAVERAVQFPRSDPIVLLSAIAAVTTRLGLVSTASTTVERPAALARRLATLDHLTRGRLGWNVVTGAGQNASARLFGEAMLPHDERYAQTEDHLQLCLKLWEGCWEDDALRQDRATGVYADPAKIHEVVHDGPYFRARGLLTVPPSPQRTPLLFQAGTSERGRDFAARYAEAVFLASEPALMAAQIADVRERAERYGREPGAIKFLAAGSFVTAPTAERARAKREQVVGFATREVAAAAYAFFTGLDLLSMDPGAPLATTRTETGRTNVDRFSGQGGAPAPTVAEILEEFRRNGVMGHPFVGDPAQVVDQAEAFIAETGADGLLVQPDPSGGHEDFLTLVLPEMRARGLVGAPTGGTLREQLFGAGRAHLPREHPGAAHRVVPAGAPAR